MYKSLIKYLTVSYFFLFSMNIYGNIMLNENDKLSTPLPLPYDGKIIVFIKHDIPINIHTK